MALTMARRARLDEAKVEMPTRMRLGARGAVRNTFCKNHRELVLKQLGDIEDLETWLDRYHPRAALEA